MKISATAVALGVLLTMPLSVVAQNWYAGGSIGESELDAWSNDSDTSIKLIGGFRFDENFAIEAAYHDFGDFREWLGRADASALSISGVGLLPLHQQWALFARAGIARTDTDTRVRVPGGTVSYSDTDVSLLAAFGVNWLVTPAVEVRLDYEIINDVSFGGNSDSDIETFGIGAVYRF